MLVPASTLLRKAAVAGTVGPIGGQTISRSRWHAQARPDGPSLFGPCALQTRNLPETAAWTLSLGGSSVAVAPMMARLRGPRPSRPGESQEGGACRHGSQASSGPMPGRSATQGGASRMHR